MNRSSILQVDLDLLLQNLHLFVILTVLFHQQILQELDLILQILNRPLSVLLDLNYLGFHLHNHILENVFLLHPQSVFT